MTGAAASDEDLRAALAAAATPAAIADAGGRIVLVNDALRQRLGDGPPPASAAAMTERLPLRALPLPGGMQLLLPKADSVDPGLFREVLDALDESIVVYDPDERYLFGNAAYHRRYPHLPGESELVGRTFEQMLRRTLAAGSFADRQAESDPDGYVRRRVAEFRALQPGRSERMTLAGRWELVRMRDTPTGKRVSIRTTITEQKRIQDELRQASERIAADVAARASFLAKLSHELRTPLGAVLGYAEMIERSVQGPLATPRYGEYAAAIRQSGQRLLDLISGVLSLSRLEAGRAEMREEAIDLASVLPRELAAVEARARENRTVLGLDLAEELPALRADPRMIVQIVASLLSNAVRHAPDATLTVSATMRADGGIDLAVADTGVGMAPDVLARVGEPYFRGPPAPTGGDPGAGLGLAMVKELAAAHQGEFAIDSAPGRGTVATVRFPPARTDLPA
ncbi:MAG: ATP-binding protein [Alphaproteobacteria bacterium]